MRYVSSEDLNHLNLLFHTRIRSESCSISRSGFSRLQNVKKWVFLRFHTHDRFLPGSDLTGVFSSSYERFLFEPAAAGTSSSSKDRGRKKCVFLFIVLEIVKKRFHRLERYFWTLRSLLSRWSSSGSILLTSIPKNLIFTRFWSLFLKSFRNSVNPPFSKLNLPL